MTRLSPTDVTKTAVCLVGAILCAVCLAQDQHQSPAAPEYQEKSLYVSPAGDDAGAGTREHPLKTFEKAAAQAQPGTTIHLLPPAVYVYVSPTGNDANSGTVQQPLRSLQAALAKARAGTVIYLLAGTYAPVSIEGVQGQEHNPIVVRGPAPPPVDYSTLEAISEKDLNLGPVRQALEGGKFTLAATDGLAVIDAAGGEHGIALRGCRGMVFENLVIQNAAANFQVHESHHITLRDAVVREARKEGVKYSAGVKLARWSALSAKNAGRDRADEQSSHLLLQRVTAYGHWGEGFWIDNDAVHGMEFDRCIAHDNGHGQPPPSRFVPNRSGFIYRSSQRSYPRHRLVRCASLNNVGDGFDLGLRGIGGLVLEHCVADGNGRYGPPFVNLRLGGGVTEGHVFRNCSVAQPVAFEGGVHELDGLFIQPAGAANRRVQ
jgi:hypothetical protein